MIFRVEKNRDYCTINNTALRDNRLSLKAKGLLVTMLSLPDDWDYSIKGLSKILKEGKDSIRSAIVELETFGYVSREQTKNERGLFTGYIYTIREVPLEVESEPLAENPTAADSTTENTTQLNTNKLNTNKLTTTTDKDISSFMRCGLNRHVKLTPEECRALDNRFGVERVRLMIQRLDSHIEKSGSYYPHHAEIISKWINEDDERLGVG